MKKTVFLFIALMALTAGAYAQDYEVLNRYMKKYSGNWCNRMTRPDSESQLGTPMPEFNFSKSLNSKALKGKTVVLTFWATWCGGCRLLCVDLDSVMMKHSNEYDNVQIIGVDSKEKLADKGYVASTFWKEKGISFPTTKPGKAADQCEESIKAGHPTTVIIDGDGILRGRWDAWSPGVAGSVALAAWAIDIAPRQGIKADLENVNRQIREKRYDRALYLLEQMPIDTMSISQRWEALLNFSGRHAIELYISLKEKYNKSADSEAGMFHRPAQEYVTMMTALADIVYDSNNDDPDILKIAREAESVAVNFGGHRGLLRAQELNLRYANAVFNRTARSLVNSLGYARKDNDTQKIATIEALLKKYNISESENDEISLDHLRMAQDEKEQSEHMARVKKK
ncbi:MAG: TlpA family protein disulfide reductase [Prevotella sp.]